MSFEYRKVVTGHNSDGLAVVRGDEIVKSEERLTGYQASTVWCTKEFPVCNDEDVFNAGKPGPKGGRVLLRIAEMLPGEDSSQQMHRTETLDYAVLLSGCCDMTLDSGEVIMGLKAGDVVIQRGTNHHWVATGTSPVRFLFVLMDAHPVKIGDKVLGEYLDNFQGKLYPMPKE